MYRMLLALIVVVAVIAGAYCQSDDKNAKSGEVEILFANGSLVRLKLVQDKIDIETAFGKLSVPLGEVRQIEFGMHKPDGVDAKVEAAVKSLASSDFKAREGAVRELTSLGAFAYPALLKAAKSAEPEVAKRATDALARIRARVTAKELKLAAEDRVVTSKFTIVGKIVTPKIKARTEYFGEAELTLPQLRQLRVLAAARDAEVTIDAAKYANANEWLDTNLFVDSAATLSIAASGQVDLSPQMPGNVVCGPQGYGPGGGGVQAGGFGGGGFGGPGVVQGKAKKGGVGGVGGVARNYAGALLGKIGEDGDVFIVGSRFQGVPEHDGKLYLHINPSPYDNSSSGSYHVKITSR